MPNKFLYSQQEARQLWVDALLSNKYSQIKGQLANINGFDPFGVACDIYTEKELKKSFKTKMGNNIVYGNNVFVLPEEVRDWLGLKTAEGHYKEYSLSFLIDTGYKFTSIAKIIMMDPPGLFENIPVEPIRKWRDGTRKYYSNPQTGLTNKN